MINALQREGIYITMLVCPSIKDFEVRSIVLNFISGNSVKISSLVGGRICTFFEERMKREFDLVNIHISLVPLRKKL